MPGRGEPYIYAGRLSAAGPNEERVPGPIPIKDDQEEVGERPSKVTALSGSG